MGHASRKQTLTPRGVSALPTPEHGQIEYRDTLTRGLACRVSATGARSWTVLYRIKGTSKLRRDTLGTVAEMSLADARGVAGEYRAKARLAIDPRPQRPADDGQRTFADLAREYLAHIKPVVDEQGNVTKPARKKKWRDDERQISRMLLRKWRRLPLTELTRRDVRDLVREYARKAPIAANRLLSLIVTILNFAVDELEWLEINPASRLAKPAKDVPRTRVLTYDEIRRVWLALDTEHFVTAALTRLKILTMQRGGELAAMKWRDIDWDQATWTQTDNKAGRPHIVPLAPEVVTMLRDLHARYLERLAEINEGRARKNVGEATGKWLPRLASDYVFPADIISRKCLPNTPIDAKLKSPMKRIREASGVTDCRAHDFRRTGASRLAELGVSRFVIARMLNHADDSITAVYDVYSYTKEKREALEMWSRKVHDIVNAKNERAA